MGRRGAVALCAATILLGAAALLPRMLRAGPVTSATPVRLDADTRPLTLTPGQELCDEEVTLDTDSERAQLTLLHVDASGARLLVTAVAPGYRSTDSVALAPLEAGMRPVEVPLAPPRTAAVGRVCLTTSGTGALQLAGTADPRALTRSQATLDGVPLQQAFSLTLLEARERAPLARLGQYAARAAALSPAGPWLFWLLLPLLLLGMPALVLAAFSLALRDDR